MKIYKIKKNIAQIIISLFLPVSVYSTPGALATFDTAMFGQAVTLTNHIVDVNRNIENQTREANRQNRMLGGYTNFDVTNGGARQLSTTVTGITRPTKSLMFAIQGVARDPINMRKWKRLDYAKDRIQNAFMPSKTRGNVITQREVHRVVTNRRNAAAESARTGAILAANSQATADEVQERIKDTSIRSANTTTIYETKKIDNEALVIIANEVRELRVLVAKLVEMKATEQLSRSDEWNQLPLYPIPRSLINRRDNNQDQGQYASESVDAIFGDETGDTNQSPATNGSNS